MVKLLTITLFFLSQIVSAQQKITLTLGKQYTSVPATVTRTAVNDNDYSAFPWNGKKAFSDGSFGLSYKKSGNHAASGAIMYGRTTDGGATFNFDTINVTGYGNVIASNLCMLVLQKDRLFFSWQKDAETSKMFFAKSYDKGSTWQLIDSITYHTAADVSGNTGYYAAQFEAIEMPYSKTVKQIYYDAPVNGTDRQHSAFINIDSSLTTVTLGDTISNQTGGSFPNGQHSEVAIVITDSGTADNNVKMVAIERNEQYEGFTHYKSSDGGHTWTRNDSYVLNVMFPAPVDRYPVSMLNMGDSIYIYAGVRHIGDYYIGYSSITPSAFFNNTSSAYSALQRIQDLNADNNGASIDCGYPMPLKDYYGKKVLHWYDTAPDYNGTDLPKHIIIYQKVLD
jgi:hypothetical protein